MYSNAATPGGKRSAFPATDRPGALASLVGFVAGAVFLIQTYDLRQGGLFLLGGLLGAALYHASFGFSGSWRAFVLERRGAAIRAQLVMLAVATAFFLPLLAQGSLFGRPLGGALAPVGVSVFVGAFLFGIGMQLGGGCGSGTLFTVGGGNRRMLVTLLFFIAGAVLGSLHLPWWLTLPSLGQISIGREFGPYPGLAVQFLLLGTLALASAKLERRRHGRLLPAAAQDDGLSLAGRLLRGPWSILWGALALALLNVATLALAGHPWSITFAFGLWGAKVLAAAGVDVAAWEFWSWPFPARALAGSVFADTTSVMNFGLVLGAMLAASLAGKFAPAGRLPAASLLAAAIGGLMMGYGARLAFGCNIGAMFSGIASGSLHGWLWLVMAFAGTVVGVRLRPLFKLPN